MRSLRLAELDVRITGGSDGGGGGDGPVVVLLHGFGAPGDDLVPLGELIEAPAGTRFVFPEAPLALPNPFIGMARAWWMLDLDRLEHDLARGRARDRSDEEPEGLAPAREQLCRLLDDLEQTLGASGDRVVLGGFSQGSMLACDTALRTDRPLAGLVLLSTTLLAQHVWVPAMRGRAGVPVFQSHGRSDHLLPFSAAERLRDHLRDAGLLVTWQGFDGGHEIPAAVLAELGSFLGRALAS
jgi:phospholipase/carboxylesterase